MRADPAWRAAEPVEAAADADGWVLELLQAARHELEAQAGAAAEGLLRSAAAQAPGQPDIDNLLGVALAQQGRTAEAVACHRRALERRPGDAGYLLNLANRLTDLRQHDQAAAAYRSAHALRPNDPRIVRGLARALAELALLDDAAAIARTIGACVAPSAEALVDCATVLVRARQLPEALQLYRQALEQRPEQAAWWLEAARIAVNADEVEFGIAACERVLELWPNHVETRVVLAALLFRRHDYPRMRTVLLELEATGMDAANAANLSGMMMVAQGRTAEGLAAMALVEQLAPTSIQLQMTRIMYLNYDPSLPAAELAAEHRRFGMALAKSAPPAEGFAERSRDPERRLRIGYLSPDLRMHSVAYFMAPILEGFDRGSFDLVAYANLRHSDTVTTRFRSLATLWRDVADLDDHQLARRIRADDIDILVDLAGYTANTRLPVLLHRPAPIQISYLGYPNTTGVPQVDYRITDGIADPDGADQLYTETLIRLPRPFLCYAYGTHAPAVAPPPHERNGYVTFGSCNSLCKVNPDVIAVWARVLQAMPGAQLLLKSVSTGQEPTQAHLRAAFAAHGIATERVRFMPYTTSLVDHLAIYNQIDIMLDTFPYNGTTTTMEALWMGVPVVTMAGDRHAGRVGASLLTGLGFTAGIAEHAEDYVATARLLAANPELIRYARAKLRRDVHDSPLCDMRGFNAALEEAYRAVWRIWCAEPPAAAFH